MWCVSMQEERLNDSCSKLYLYFIKCYILVKQPKLYISIIEVFMFPTAEEVQRRPSFFDFTVMKHGQQ